LCEGGLTII